MNWVGGLFYSNAERRYGQSLPITGFEAASGFPTMRDHAARDELFFSDLNYDFNQVALFGEVSVAVTERFNLTGGLRWYDFDEQRIQTFDGFYADPGTTTGETTATGAAPRLIASYDVTESTQINAQVSQGFRLGGINDPLNTPICTPRDLETFGNRGHQPTAARRYRHALPGRQNETVAVIEIVRGAPSHAAFSVMAER